MRLELGVRMLVRIYPRAGAIGGKLVCPVHRHHFDLESGRGDPGQGNFIPVFPIQTIEGKMCVGMKVPWWKRIF